MSIPVQPKQDESLPTRDELFREYELCQKATQDVESKIWTTGGIIGIAALATISYLAQTKISTLEQALQICSIGTVTILVLWIWWDISRRWWDIQHITFMRMRDIEEKLGIYQCRYISFIDGKLSIFDTNLYKELTKGKIKNLLYDKRVGKHGVQKYLRWFPILLSISWGAFIFFQVHKYAHCPTVSSVLFTLIYFILLIAFHFLMQIDIGDDKKKRF